MNLLSFHRALVIGSAGAIAFATPAAAGQRNEPPAGNSAIVETSPSNQLANRIATLGVVEYPEAYAAATPTSPTDVTVYATGDRAGLLNAINRLPHRGVAVTVKTAQRDYAQLESLTKRIARDSGTLAAQGVELHSWGPDGMSGTVKIILVKPNGVMGQRDMAKRADTTQSVLDRRYGTGTTTVEDTPEALPHETLAKRPAAIISRDNDYPPYYAGDAIIVPTPKNTACTSGWGTKGNKSGDSFILSAGHCGTGEVSMEYGAKDDIGPVATQYYDEVKGDALDFETIRGSADGYVWQSGSNDYAVLGFDDPPVGTYMTVNGDVTGERTNNRVTLQDACITVANESDSGTHIVCNVGQALGPSAICHGGDSGGPAYVRNSTATAVYASGTIVASGDTHCDFQEAHTELTTANLSIDTGTTAVANRGRKANVP